MRISRLLPTLVCAAIIGAAFPTVSLSARGADAPATMIVTGSSVDAAAAAVSAVGGEVAETVTSARSVITSLDRRQVARLGRIADVVVTPDQKIAAAGADYNDSARPVQLDALMPAVDWSADAGSGVGVALIDTGVAEVPDLAGRVVDGPDLSGDGDGLDRYGHGTFMAGLIAGTGVGIAPSAHIVSVKVAGADGSTSLVRLLVALDWVINHRAEFAIEVVNLSFAADAADNWHADPLALASTFAAASGLTVVAAAGNDGEQVASPALAPSVVAVGAIDTFGTATRIDDRRPSWSSQSPKVDKPELLAPGVSTVSLRVPDSTIDRSHPEARVGDRYFLGSGTSMATALASGSAAVVAASHPDATAAAVRQALVTSGDQVPMAVGVAVNLARADSVETAAAVPQLGRTIDVRTVITVVDAGWTGTWSGTRWAGTRWAGTRWAGTRWAEDQWAGTRWAGTRWAGTRWAGIGWSAEPVG